MPAGNAVHLLKNVYRQQKLDFFSIFLHNAFSDFKDIVHTKCVIFHNLGTSTVTQLLIAIWSARFLLANDDIITIIVKIVVVIRIQCPIEQILNIHSIIRSS